MNFQYKTFKSVKGLETDIKSIRYDHLYAKYELAWPVIDDDFVFFLFENFTYRCLAFLHTNANDLDILTARNDR